MTVPEAAGVLGLPVSGVEALVDAGYLRVDDGARVPLSELKAFQARNAAGSGDTVADLLGDLGGADSGADDILDALEAGVEDMARRTADIVGGVFPEAAAWTPRQRSHFEGQARARFEAILAVTRADSSDDDLLSDLAEAGGAAAFAGAPLPQVLMTLRISRDLLVQAAVSAAEELGRKWGLALAVVLTRVLPVLDRLTDTVARGWWSVVLTREQEAYARYEHVVEHSASGVYEVDLTGSVLYANPMLRQLSGHGTATDVAGRDMAELLPPEDPGTPLEVYRTPTEGWTPVTVLRADGVRREILLQVSERTEEGEAVGYDGIIRDVTAERTLERQKNDFLALITQELRQPLAAVLGLGVTLELHADELPRERIANMGRSIHLQSDRIARLADDLHDVSRIRADSLTLVTRDIELRYACEAALRLVGADGPEAADVDLDVPSGISVVGDSRRLEQVVAHLVENALRHGEPPVTIRARQLDDDLVELVVADVGPGVPLHEVDGLFSAIRPTAVDDRLRDRPSGIGLPLARSLVEAMGGRIHHEAPARGGARFTIRLRARA